MTEKLYESDAYVQSFTATVRACTPEADGYAVVLDRTAFFPEGGGQPCDTGTLGGARVTAVHTRDGEVRHTTDIPLPAGETVTGTLDWARRLDAMQQHTGEHILSGTLHRLYGAENVGFHIGTPYVRMDTSIPLTAEQLAQAEAEANAAVRADTPVHCFVPDAATLAATEYRSKKELEGPVRLVEAGGDRCACCGTHLHRTGEVGLIKILAAQHYKSGLRLTVACGQRAVEAVAHGWADAEAAGRLVSAPVGGLQDAVGRLQNAETSLKQRLAALQNQLADAYAAAARPGEVLVVSADGADGGQQGAGGVEAGLALYRVNLAVNYHALAVERYGVDIDVRLGETVGLGAGAGRAAVAGGVGGFHVEAQGQLAFGDFNSSGNLSLSGVGAGRGLRGGTYRAGPCPLHHGYAAAGQQADAQKQREKYCCQLLHFDITSR